GRVVFNGDCFKRPEQFHSLMPTFIELCRGLSMSHDFCCYLHKRLTTIRKSVIRKTSSTPITNDMRDALQDFAKNLAAPLEQIDIVQDEVKPLLVSAMTKVSFFMESNPEPGDIALEEP
ncbi:MAG: hypothetical protein Q9218_008250, partial [Villophora microphyllina]